MKIHRRNFLQLGAGVVLGSTAHTLFQKQQAVLGATANLSIKIGYLPLAAGLPFYLALEKGYFRQAKINVEAVKFSTEQQVVTALMSGQIHGSANGIGSDNLATGAINSPGILKIIAANTIGGTLNSPWFGGSAALNTQFFERNSSIAKKYIEIYRRAIISIRRNPEEARQYLKGYTRIQNEHTKAAYLPEYRMYDEFTAVDIDYFQKFFDLVNEKIQVASLILQDVAIA